MILFIRRKLKYICFPTLFIASLSKFTSAIIRLFSLPLLISYLPLNDYALYCVITSLENWFLSFCDFGIGISVQNFLSEEKALNISSEHTKNITIHCSLFSFVLLPILLIVLGYFQKIIFGNLASDYSKMPLLFAAGAYFFSCWGHLGYRVYFVNHKSHYAYLLQAIIQLITISFLIFFLMHYKGPYLLAYSIIITAALPALFAFFIFLKNFLPFFKFLKFSKGKLFFILKRSYKFWILAFLSAFTLGIDYFVMTRTLRAEDISLYNFLTKIFSFSFFIFQSHLASIFPKIAECSIQNKSTRHFVFPTLFVGFFIIFFLVLVLIITTPWIDRYLFKHLFHLSLSSIVFYGIYALIRIFSDTFSLFYQASSRLTFLFIFMPLQAMFSLLFQFYFSKKIGMNGALIGLSCSYLVTVFWGLPLFYYEKHKKHKKSLRWS